MLNDVFNHHFNIISNDFSYLRINYGFVYELKKNFYIFTKYGNVKVSTNFSPIFFHKKNESKFYFFPTHVLPTTAHGASEYFF